MPGINLLPENLKLKEEKERAKAAKQGGPVVEMNMPGGKAASRVSDSSKRPPSFWEKLFGTPEKREGQTVGSHSSSATGMQSNRPLQGKIDHEQESWAMGVLGKPATLIDDSQAKSKDLTAETRHTGWFGGVNDKEKTEKTKKAKPAKEHYSKPVREVKPKDEPRHPSLLPQPNKSKAKNGLWAQILGSIFAPKRKDDHIRLAGDNDARRMKDLVKADLGNVSKEGEIKARQEKDGSAWGNIIGSGMASQGRKPEARMSGSRDVEKIRKMIDDEISGFSHEGRITMDRAKPEPIKKIAEDKHPERLRVAVSEKPKPALKEKKSLVRDIAPKPEKQKPEPKKEKKKKQEKVSSQYHDAPRVEEGGWGINLIPQELAYRTRPDPKSKIAALLLVALLCSLLVFVIYSYLNYQQGKIDHRISQIREQNEAINAELENYRVLEAKTNRSIRKIMAIGNLIGNHVYWTKFLTTLEKYTLDDVYFSGFSADTSGTLVLPAVAKDYNSAIRQVAALEQADDFVSDVKVSSMKLFSDQNTGETYVSFEIRLRLANNVFNK